MQRQKIAAKCLAVILALTAAIACYLVFSSVHKGVKESASGSVTTGAGASEPAPPPHVPVYSELPRECEVSEGKSVAHVGGEKEEVFLDASFVDGKWLVLFKTQSAEYDVTGAGLYIACFEEGTLTKVCFVSDDETYVCSLLTAGGYLVVTRKEEKTVMRLFGSDLLVSAVATTKAYRDYKFFTTEDGTLVMYAYDGTFVRRFLLSSSLESKGDNFVYPVRLSSFFYATSFDGADLLFIDADDGAQVVEYDKKSGFIVKNNIDKARFLQVIPNTSDDKQTFVTLYGIEDGFALELLSESGKKLNSAEFAGSSAFMRTEGSDVRLFVDDAEYRFCSHLQKEGERRISYEAPAGARFLPIPDGDLAYAVCDGALLVLEFGEEVREVYSAKCSGGATAAKINGKLNLFYAGAGEGAFGESDIFFISMLT